MEGWPQHFEVLCWRHKGKVAQRAIRLPKGGDPVVLARSLETASRQRDGQRRRPPRLRREKSAGFIGSNPMERLFREWFHPANPPQLAGVSRAVRGDLSDLILQLEENPRF